MRGRRVMGWVGAAANLTLTDVAANRAHHSEEAPFLILRDARNKPGFYDPVLHWLAFAHPGVRARFELHQQPALVRDVSRFAVHVPWLQDPVQAWTTAGYRRANALARRCDAAGVPVVNRVDRLLNASKSTGATLIGSTGLRTAKMVRVTDAEGVRQSGLALPLFVREDWGHGESPVLRIDDPAQLAALDQMPLRRPVAVERVDVAEPDGTYRKFRYVVAGSVGVPHSMHASGDWVVRGDPLIPLFDEAILAQEIAYQTKPCPFHDRFVAAREALGLDVVAFDFSLDHAGEPVVWEANPYFQLVVHTGRRRYRNGLTTAVMASMVVAYYRRAGLEPPGGLIGELIAPAVLGV